MHLVHVAFIAVSYTHLDVYKRQVSPLVEEAAVATMRYVPACRGEQIVGLPADPLRPVVCMSVSTALSLLTSGFLHA